MKIFDASNAFSEIIRQKGDFDFAELIDIYQLSDYSGEIEANSEYIFDWDGDLDQFLDDAEVEILKTAYYNPADSKCWEFPDSWLDRQIGNIEVLFRVKEYSIPIYVMDNGCMNTAGLCLAKIKEIN